MLELQGKFYCGVETMSNQDIGLSFGDKLSKAYYLSLEILYTGGRCIELRDLSHLPEDTIDDLFAWADGLHHKYHEKRQSGQCSLSAMVSYNIEIEEQKIDQTIAEFREILRGLGELT